MIKFIEITDSAMEKRLININHISDIFDRYVHLDCCAPEQIKIRCSHSYEELKQKLIDAGVEVFQ